MHATLPLLIETGFPNISRGRLETLQVNLGYKCNQSCLHCHVNAGPNRTEMMDRETLDAVIRFMDASSLTTLDLTGGAPEINPLFRTLVSAARTRGLEVIDRCNLTILLEPGQQDTASFLAGNGVKVVASMPCYIKDNVESQRGKGTFDASLEALRLLNELGYGQPGSGLELDLVFNPQDAVLPPLFILTGC
jgi:radical SAM/Cys-rich protein